MALDKSVVTKKRNHIYRGRTSSEKISATFGEVSVDMGSISTHLNNNATDMAASASQYLSHGDDLGLVDSELFEQEKRLEKIYELEATTDAVYVDLIPENGRLQTWAAATLSPPTYWTFEVLVALQ